MNNQNQQDYQQQNLTFGEYAETYITLENRQAKI